MTTATDVKYPDIFVQLSGRDGSAFSIIGAVSKEMKKAGVEPERIAEFRAECMAENYDELLQAVMRWVDVG